MSTGAGHPRPAAVLPGDGIPRWAHCARFLRRGAALRSAPEFPVLHRASGSRADAICILANAACGSGANQPSLCGMAIAFARARYISRSTGGSAVRSAAYNAREAIRAERTGALYYFTHRDTPEHHEVLLPDGASAKLADAGACCGTRPRRPSGARTRSLPARSCWRCRRTPSSRSRIGSSSRGALRIENFVSKGLAVQLDVHAPHAGDIGVRARQLACASADHDAAHGRGGVCGEEGARSRAGGQARRRARRRERRRGLGRGLARSAEPLLRRDRDSTSASMRRARSRRRISARSACGRPTPRRTRGPTRSRARTRRRPATRPGAGDAHAQQRHVHASATSSATSPSTSPIVVERDAVKERVLGHSEVLALHDRESGESVGRFTTKTVRAQERQALGGCGGGRGGENGPGRAPGEGRSA